VSSWAEQTAERIMAQPAERRIAMLNAVITGNVAHTGTALGRAAALDQNARLVSALRELCERQGCAMPWARSIKR